MADAWSRTWVAFVRQQDGAGSPAYAGALAALGLNLLQQSKWSDTESALRESLAIREKTQAAVWTTFNTQSLLGAAFLGQRKYAEAGPPHLKGYGAMRQREELIPSQGRVRLTEVVERLVQHYEVLGHNEDAAKWKKELETSNGAKKKAAAKQWANWFARARSEYQTLQDGIARLPSRRCRNRNGGMGAVHRAVNRRRPEPGRT